MFNQRRFVIVLQQVDRQVGHSYVGAIDASKILLDTLKVAGQGLLADMEMVTLSRKKDDMVVSKLACNRSHGEV